MCGCEVRVFGPCTHFTAFQRDIAVVEDGGTCGCVVCSVDNLTVDSNERQGTCTGRKSLVIAGAMKDSRPLNRLLIVCGFRQLYPTHGFRCWPPLILSSAVSLLG